jgi:hypothetical protein
MVSFSFNARGTAAEVVSSLDGLTPSQLGHDGLGDEIRDAIVEAVSQGADLEPPADQRYQVTAHGHSGRNSVISLFVEVKLVPFPYESTPVAVANVPLTEQGAAGETISISSP